MAAFVILIMEMAQFGLFTWPEDFAK